MLGKTKDTKSLLIAMGIERHSSDLICASVHSLPGSLTMSSRCHTTGHISSGETFGVDTQVLVWL